MFIVREDCTFENYLVLFDANKLPDGLSINTSYHILCARVLGFTYPDYLRFCICNGAYLKGREGYCYPVFKDKKDAQKIAKLCNEYWKPYSKKLELGVG